jgi:hypothetical protein
MAVSPEQILEYIRQHPGQKAKAIATALGSDVSLVNRALYGPLFGKVHRDGQYQWFPAGASARSVMAKAETPLTTLGRLCRYYLACLEIDVADGDSIFATSKFDDLQYAPLARLPLLPEVGPEVYDTAACRRLLQRRNDGRNPMAVRLGYPIRLRRISTPRWTGLKLEPVASFATVIEDGVAFPDIDPRSFFFNLAALRGMPGCVTDSPIPISDSRMRATAHGVNWARPGASTCLASQSVGCPQPRQRLAISGPWKPKTLTTVLKNTSSRSHPGNASGSTLSCATP